MLKEEEPLGCFYCENTQIPLDWYRKIHEYVCKKCAKKKRLM